MRTRVSNRRRLTHFVSSVRNPWGVSRDGRTAITPRDWYRKFRSVGVRSRARSADSTEGSTSNNVIAPLGYPPPSSRSSCGIPLENRSAVSGRGDQVSFSSARPGMPVRCEDGVLRDPTFPTTQTPRNDVADSPFASPFPRASGRVFRSAQGESGYGGVSHRSSPGETYPTSGGSCAPYPGPLRDDSASGSGLTRRSSERPALKH